MLYLGIDQHAKQLTVSLRDEGGDVILSRQVSTEPERFKAFFSTLAGRDSEGFVAIVEVCGFNDWLLEALPQYGCRQCILIQPESKRRIKTDYRDAKHLSEQLWVNRGRLLAGKNVRGVRRVVLPTAADAQSQRITLMRQRVSRQHTRCVNQIKHILRRHNLQWSMPTKTFPSQKALRWLSELSLPTWDRYEVSMHVEDLQRLRALTAKLDAEILQRCEGDKAVALLRTVPGFAAMTALAIRSRIGEASRFPSGRSLPHYFGLAPNVSDSGESTGRRGHITKAGSSMARWLLGQAVLHVLRKDAEMKRWYKAIRARRGSKIARVAVMRRLAAVIRNMLVHEMDYQSCREMMLARRKKQQVQPHSEQGKKQRPKRNPAA